VRARARARACRCARPPLLLFTLFTTGSSGLSSPPLTPTPSISLDKSSIDDPHVRLQAASTLERYLRSLNGNTDFVLEDFSAYVSDSTKSKKDTNVIMNELLLDLFLHVNGEKHCVLVFDCGG
jgi:hypothetical protein